jgi:5-methyltetrahydropteroyltriglutamate--homocysteine methyltransferase
MPSGLKLYPAREEGMVMKTSAERILTTHVGSLPRPESIKALLRARLGGQPLDESQLATCVAEAVTAVVRLRP